MLLALALWTMLFPCTVRGSLSTDGQTVSLVRDDGCAVRVLERTVDQFVLAEGQTWVLVSVPGKFRQIGPVPFWYEWGSHDAHFGRESYAVQLGRIFQG